jgi:hypothetical protein
MDFLQVRLIKNLNSKVKAKIPSDRKKHVHWVGTHSIYNDSDECRSRERKY